MEPNERPKTLEPINDNYCRSLVPAISNDNFNSLARSPSMESTGQRKLVRQSVRNVVGNLENVLGNLQGIVGDIRILVNQIECVSNKLDKKFGVYWKKGDNNNETNDTTLSDSPTDNISAILKQRYMDSFECMQFSPDFDWTYITMATYQNNPFFCCSSPQFESDRSPSGSDNGNFRGELTEEDSEDLSEASLMSMTSTDVSRCSSIPSSCSRHSILSSTTPSSVVSEDLMSPTFAYIDVFHLCCQSTGDVYCGVYEILMESTLENTKGLNDSFDTSEDDDEEEEEAVDEIEVTSVGDYKANYDRDLNTWTTFTLLHTDSITDSDDYISETKSDILNDNTLEKLESTVFRNTREKFRGSESSIFENIAFKDKPLKIC